MYSKKVQPGEVRDDQGRRRFHGAFTGGFSAGYYNSVGSEEGWTPSTFVSSRDKRANLSQQRAEDFMDEEDGLLGKEVRASEDYDTLGTHSSNAAKLEAINEARSSRSLIPGAAPMELMVVSGQPIGKRLLQTMGWREGTGVGARVKRHKHKEDTSEKEELLAITDSATGGGKLDQGADSGGSVAELLGASFANTKHVAEDGEITFAPNDKDARIVIPKPKNDSYGIGYDPFKENPEFEHARRENVSSNTGVYRMGMGVASGSHVSHRSATGFAIDDGEDDVYDSGMSAGGGFHELALIEESDEAPDMSWKYPTKNGPKLPDVFRAADDLSSLPGFVCPKPTPEDTPLHWQPPAVPRTWRPVHHFTTPPPVIEERKTRPSVATRQEMLGDKPAHRAVVPPRPSSSIQDATTAATTSNSGTSDKGAPVRPLLGVAGGAAFALNPALAAAMKSRFAPAVEVLKPDNNQAGGLKTLDKIVEDASKVPLTEAVAPVLPLVSVRETSLWIPDVLLCKRFNVVPPASLKQGIKVMDMGKDNNGQIVQDRFNTHVAPFLQNGEVGGRSQSDVAAIQDTNKFEGSMQEQRIDSISSSELLANIEQGDTIVSNTILASVDLVDEKPKPQVDFFKAIFEPSDESESEEEEDDDDEDVKAKESDTGESDKIEAKTEMLSGPKVVEDHRSQAHLMGARQFINPPPLPLKRKLPEPTAPLPSQVTKDALYAMLRNTESDSASSDSDSTDSEKKKSKKKSHKKKKHKSDKKKKKKKEKKK